MNKPKIIFFDVDGTLVPLKGAARPRTLEALRRLHQNGIRLCIATGLRLFMVCFLLIS